MRIPLAALLLLVAAAAFAQDEIPSGRGPIAVNPVTNRIYVAEIDELIEIDAATGAQRRVDVPALVLGGSGKGSVLGIDPIHNRIYATQPSLDQVAVIDGRTLAVETVAGGGGNWRFASAPALDPSRDLAWVVDADGSLARIRGSTRAVDRLDLGPFLVTNPVVDPVAGKVFVAITPNEENSGLIAVDEDTLAAVASPPIDILYSPAAVAVDPRASRIYAQEGSTDSEVTHVFDATTFARTGGGWLWLGDYAGELSADPAFDRVWSLVGEDGCGYAGALAGDGSGLVPETRFLGCGSALANPATRFAYAFTAHECCPGPPFGVLAKDTSSTSPPTETPLPPEAVIGAPRGDSATLALNVAENRVYVAAWNQGGVVYAIDEPRRAPIPIPTTLWNEPPRKDGTVVVHASASTAWPLPVRGVYWQADAIDGAWSPVTPTGAAGTATVALAPGAHEIHAFAVDGQEATLGEFQRRSPIVGPTTTLPVYVATTQPHVDVEVDSPWTDRSLPRSGAIPVQVSLVNATGGPQTFALLLSLRVPGVGDVTLLPATGMQLPNGVGFAAAIHLPIGDFLPPGVYTLGAIVLQAGGVTADQSAMTFTVE